MRCKQAKRQIALSVGKDLVLSAESELQRHITSCPDCRAHARQMRDSLAVLQAYDAATVDERLPSVWPRVRAQLQAVPEAPPARPSLGLAPAFAVLAACLIMYVSMNYSIGSSVSSPLDVLPVRSPAFEPTPIVAPIEPFNRMEPFDGRTRIRPLEQWNGPDRFDRSPLIYEYR
jgi:hypothetical protein